MQTTFKRKVFLHGVFTATLENMHKKNKMIMKHDDAAVFSCLGRNALLMQTKKEKGSIFFGGWTLLICMKEAGCGSGVIQL